MSQTRQQSPSLPFGVVVIGGSAGALEPMRSILSGLPGSFPAAVAVILHRSPDMPSALSSILARATDLEVLDATEGAEVRQGWVLVAPPDRNLVLEPHGAVSFRSGRTHFVASAIDPVMESAAAVYGGRVVAVILSGGGDDGTPGARAVREAGGVVIVQDPATASMDRMPASVVGAGLADAVLPPEEIAGLLVRLAEEGRAALAHDR